MRVGGRADHWAGFLSIKRNVGTFRNPKKIASNERFSSARGCRVCLFEAYLRNPPGVSAESCRAIQA